MQRLQAFRFELMPNGQQERQMRRFAGACRFIYNKALALQKERYERGEKKLGYAGLCKLLTEWRNSAETAWLADAPIHPLQQKLKDLERAYSNFFAKRADFPRFKKKGRSDSFRYPDPKQIKLDQGNSRIFLPKLGWLRYRNSRKVLGDLRNVTVSLSGGKWFVSIQTEQEVEQAIPQGGAVGIDMGIARFATLSDGTFYAPLNSFKRHEVALRKAQQAMSRKVKFSNNWKKAKARVQRIHSRIGNARRDFLHKASTAISKNHAMVCIEDLQVRNMSKSAAGTADAPGRNVRAKSGLNKSILDQGWFEFRRQLDYKLAWKGGHLIAVPPQNTSRTCPGCGHVSADNRQTQARFVCVACGYENNADVVGAINILSRGIQLLRDEGQDTANALVGMQVDWLPVSARMACGSNCIGSRKQEPAETTARGAIRA
jgi:putative transposase